MPEQQKEAEGVSVSTHVIRFGPYAVDRRAGEVRKHDQRIRLSGQPLEVLSLLLERPGEVITREEIRQRLWAEDVFVDFERSLNSAVKKLRRALNDDPQEPRYIETLPKKGYRFIGTIESEAKVPSLADTKLPDSATESAADLSPVTAASADEIGVSASAKRSATGRRWMIAGIAGALAVTLGFVYYRYHRTHLPTQSARSKYTNFRSSIAVLGFKNLSSGREADWLSTAMTQMLSTELSAGEKIRIIPEETVSQAKRDLGLQEKNGYPREALRALRTDLGSDYVIAGSYVAVGDKSSGQVRIDLRLQETISGATLASIAVSGKQSEIFGLVARAGQEIRSKLGSTVPPEGDVDWRTVLPSDPEAARLYSEGLAKLRISEILAARDLLDKSVQIAPDFALGHAALAEAWSALGHDARAAASAQKALSLSTSLPEDERLAIEGRYYELNHDWAGAIGVYRHLWQDFPDDLESGLKLAEAQLAAGNADEALNTLSGLRSGPLSQRDDPRIDLAEASLAERNGDYKRQQALAEQAAVKAKSSGARLLLARAQLVKGWSFDNQSELQQAKEAYLTAQKTFEQAGEGAGTATAWNDLGIVLQKEGDLKGAEEKLGQARDYFRQVGDENRLGAALINLGEVYRVEGRLADAEDQFREALKIFRNIGRKDNEYTAMNNLGTVLYQVGNFREARKLYEDLLVARKAAGDKSGVAFAKTNLAAVLRVQGESENAVTMFREALATFKELGDRSTAAAVQLSYAQALVDSGEFAAARRLLNEAMTTNQEIGAKEDAATDRVMLTRVSLEEGRSEEAEADLQSLIEQLKNQHRETDELEARTVAVEVLLRQQKVRQAEEALQGAQAISSTDWLAKFRFSLASARLKAARGDVSSAMRRLNALSTEVGRVGCVPCQNKVRLVISEIARTRIPIAQMAR